MEPSKAAKAAYEAFQELENENISLRQENTRLQGLLNDFTEELTKIRMVLTELLMAYQVCPICFGDNGQHVDDCRWVKAVAGALLRDSDFKSLPVVEDDPS